MKIEIGSFTDKIDFKNKKRTLFEIKKFLKKNKIKIEDLIGLIND